MAGATPDGVLTHQYTAVLDLRVHDPRERLPLLELTLSALSPGEDLLLVTDSQPARLRDHIHQQYGQEWAWEQFEAGPELWRARLVRTETGQPA